MHNIILGVLTTREFMLDFNNYSIAYVWCLIED